MIQTEHTIAIEHTKTSENIDAECTKIRKLRKHMAALHSEDDRVQKQRISNPLEYHRIECPQVPFLNTTLTDIIK